MKKTNIVIGAFFIFLLVFGVTPLFANQAKAQNANDNSEQPQVSSDGQWWQINTSTITVMFPAQGQKPMFLWHYTNNSDMVYVVKYQGLIEYLPLNQNYYTPDCEANPQTMESLMMSRYGMGGGMHMGEIQGAIGNAYQSWVSDFHPSYLPFGACTWDLTGPIEGTDENGAAYVAFNFSLRVAPSEFGFAQDNVNFGCRFYENQSTQQPYGLYSYEIGAGELKMDMTVNDWTWNSNYMTGLFTSMHNNYGIDVSSQSGSLALWCDFASINMQDLDVALNDANEQTTVPQNSTLAPMGLVEGSSTMTDIIAGNHQIHMQSMDASTAASLGITTGTPANYRMQFAQGDKTLPGYFDFVNNAAVIDPTTHTAYSADASASYHTADNYMQLYVCYPYFGANTLEHDPTIGIDTSADLIPENPAILLVVIAVTLITAATAIISRKLPRKTHVKP